jgi:DNA-binding LytR/AlgR family response regulator
MSYLHSQTQPQRKAILLSSKKEKIFVAQDDIVCIIVRDNYCSVYYISDNDVKKYVVTKQLKHYENTLDHRLFYRTSEKDLVNMSYVASHTLSDNTLKLKKKFNNCDIPVSLSTRRRKGFFERFSQ